MSDETRSERKEKKPYTKPTLDSAIVYEASGRTCCKVTAAACNTSARGAAGKTHQTSTAS